jgi:hypothetical protein
MAKRPSFQFYPGDWLRDKSLQTCSLEARGLWIQMLCLMHDNEPYGYLTIGGGSAPMPPGILGALANVRPISRTPKLLAELEREWVFSRNESGVIYSRRMVKDEHIRSVRMEAGKAGGGNPAVCLNKNEAKQPAKRKQTVEDEEEDCSTQLQQQFSRFWELYPRKVAKPTALKAFTKVSPSEELFGRIIQAIETQKLSDQWTRDEGKFIPHPATWLNQERWNDEVVSHATGPRISDETKATAGAFAHAISRNLSPKTFGFVGPVSPVETDQSGAGGGVGTRAAAASAGAGHGGSGSLLPRD